MKKKVKVLLVILFTILLIIINSMCVFAFDANDIKVDVGSFEDYGGSSSWDSDSSWSSSSSSWDSGSYDYGGYSSSGSNGSSSKWTDEDKKIFLIFIFIVMPAYFLIIIFADRANRRLWNKINQFIYENKNGKMVLYNKDEIINERIKKHTPDFDINKFKNYAGDVFVKLQNAWTDREWEPMRIVETPELFEMHKTQLQGYINNNQINVIADIVIKDSTLSEYSFGSDKEIIKVDLLTSMKDYIIDADTKELIRGFKDRDLVHIYRLTFIRIDRFENEPIKCPNCGADINANSNGKCEYCGTVISTYSYNWTLSNLERIKYFF